MPNKKLDLTNGKTCPRCKEFKPMDGYSLNKCNTTGYQTYCKPCMSQRHDEYRRKNLEKIAGKQRERYAANKPRYRMYDLKNRYGITPAQYTEMLAAQGDACAICKSTVPTGKDNLFHVDHCHTSGKVRGLLCSRCNMGLGQFKHSAELLHSAVSYLAKSG